MAAPSLTQFQNGVSTVTADMLNTFYQTCDNLAQLRGLVGVTGMQVYVRGSVSSGDGLGGQFWWNSTSALSDDNATVIRPTGGATLGRWVLLPLASTNLVVATEANSIAGQTTIQGAFDALDALAQPKVINATTTIPPASPNNGDAYIVPTGATGVWATQVGNIAVWQRGAWAFYVPKTGWQVYNTTTATAWVFNVTWFQSVVVGEVPTGTINGTNTVFTTAKPPAVGTLAVYRNGVRTIPTTEWSLSGSTITFVRAPVTGDTLLIDYMRQS